MKIEQLRTELKCEGWISVSRTEGFNPYGCTECDDDNFGIYAIKNNAIVWQVFIHEMDYESSGVEEKVGEFLKDPNTIVVSMHHHDCAGMGCRHKKMSDFNKIFR